MTASRSVADLPLGIASLLLVVAVLAGCATRTPGQARVGATDPPPATTWPRWRATDPRDRGVPDAPRGFKVEDQGGAPIRMRRMPDGDAVELWRPYPEDLVSRHPVLTMVDPDLVAGWTWIIAVLETDEPRRPETAPIPRRRATDGILLTPRDPAPATAGTLVVVLGSLARYNPPEQWLVTTLLRHGFTVLLSSPPVASPLGPAGRRATIDIAASPARAGRTLAREVDLATAIWSVGLQAILDDLDPPPTPRFPTLVLIGASSGTVALPSVAVRLGRDRTLSGLVFIGGGADTGLILAETTLGNDDLRLDRRGGILAPAEIRAFVEAFQADATRDDPTIWSWLDRHPSVLLEAGFDRAIPHRARRELRHRLPGATHWWYPLGHYGLFVLLSSESEAIVDWILETLDARASSSVPATPAGFDAESRGRST